MNKIRNIGIGGGRAFLTLALVATFFLSYALSSFAIDKGTEIKAASAPADAGLDTYADPETVDKVFEKGKEDYLGFDPLYVVKYHNPDYVNLDDTGVDSFVQVVTAAKGIASYTIDKDKSLDDDTVIAAMPYEIPVYDVDAESDYYIAIPNVNLFNDNFKTFGLVVAYNNDHGETIDGWKFEKGILYIPKTAIDDPSNTYEVLETMSIGIQLNYAIGGDADFSKSIPVQILADHNVENKTLKSGNIFDDAAVQVDTGITGRKAEDIDVYLNGQMMPIFEEGWDYDSKTGTVSISVMPGVVSSINVVFADQSPIGAIAGVFSPLFTEAYAATQSSMEYFKNSEGKVVTAKFDQSKMFVGWRGQYTSTIKWPAEQSTIENSAGALNSLKYLYGSQVTAGAGSFDNASDDQIDQWTAQLWAVQSYAVGADVRAKGSGAGTITPSEKITHYLQDSTEQEAHTIYEWLYGSSTNYSNKLEKSKDAYGRGYVNGIGGANNFVFKAPENKTVNGFDTVFAPNQDSNPNIKFTFDGLADEPWLLAGCSELDSAAAEGADDDSDVSMVCLGMKDDYVVFAFVNTAKSQNMTAIYKFKVEPTSGHVKLKKVSANTDITG